jgi:hypothetical protein
MLWITLDITYITIAQCYADATATGAHVTGRVFGLDTTVLVCSL